MNPISKIQEVSPSQGANQSTYDPQQSLHQLIEGVIKRQEDIHEILIDIQRRVKSMEAKPSSSGGRKPINFGTVPLLHQKGKPTEVIRRLTNEEKMIAVIKGLPLPKE